MSDTSQPTEEPDTKMGFHTYPAEFIVDPSVGLEICPDNPERVWLSWDETVQLHAWLGEVIGKESANG